MSFHVEYQFYSPSLRQYSIPPGVIEYSSAGVNKFRNSTKVCTIFTYCSAAAQNIKMG